MKLSIHSSYLVKIAAGLVAVAGLILLLAGWQTVSAHSEGEAGHSHGSPDWSWDDGNQLTLTGDISSMTDTDFARDDDNKIIWQYVGPSTADDITNCNELGWLTLEEKAKSVEATVSADSSDIARVSLDTSSAADQSRYCFSPQLDLGGELFTYYLLSQPLQASAAQPADEAATGLVVSETAPPADSNVPSTVTVSAAAGTEIDADSWQYAEVSDVNDCNSSNDGISFNDPAAGNNAKDLDAAQAGKIFCFRAQLADSDEHVYKAYQVSGEASSTEVADEEDGGVSWIFVVAAIAVIGIIVFIITRAAKSKE